MSINPHSTGKYANGSGKYVKLSRPLSRYPGLENEVGHIIQPNYNYPTRGRTTWAVAFKNTQVKGTEREYLSLSVDSNDLEEYKDKLPICAECAQERQEVCWEVSCRYGWTATLITKCDPKLALQLGVNHESLML